MNKFRADGRDVAPTPRKAKPSKPGQTPAGRLGIYDSQNRYRGHCGPSALASTCARFGVPNAELSTDDNGQPCWRGKREKS